EIATRRRAASAVALVAGTLRGRSRVDKNAIAALEEAFRSGSSELSLDAAEALRQLPDAAPGGGPAAFTAVFQAALGNEQSDRRAAAAWALGQVGLPAIGAVPSLREALDGPDEVLGDASYFALNRLAAASGLDRLGNKRDGRYELKPEVMAKLLEMSGREKAAVAR